MFTTMLDSLEVNQNILLPTHYDRHSFDLILTIGLNIKILVTVRQSKAISDHYLVLFKMLLQLLDTNDPDSFCLLGPA